jgi:antitoxin (DNA-binding transcriptional repressor) of toxin-antitoxin stability system
MTRQVSIEDVRHNLEAIVAGLAGGDMVEIVRDDRVVAVIRAPEPARAPHPPYPSFADLVADFSERGNRDEWTVTAEWIAELRDRSPHGRARQSRFDDASA